MSGFKLPGYRSTFQLSSPLATAPNFYWSEVTHGGERIPWEARQVSEILRLGALLQQARGQIGRPFLITSWLRTQAINDATPGAAPNSRHLTGGAADLWVPGFSGRELYDRLAWWPGGMGIYTQFPELIHLDTGPKRRW